jgi:DNA-binding SARP family transcriptional activator
MTTLAEIEAAAEELPPEQKEELLRFLAERIRRSNKEPRKARLVRQGNDVLLEAQPDAPPMTPENVKRMLEDWP